MYCQLYKKYKNRLNRGREWPIFKISSINYSNKGKFHCTANLLFDSIIYIQISKFVANVYVAMQLNPMQTKVEVSRTVIDPLIKL